MLKSAETKRKYIFYFKYKPKTMRHKVEAPAQVANYMESQWKEAGLKFARVK